MTDLVCTWLCERDVPSSLNGLWIKLEKGVCCWSMCGLVFYALQTKSEQTVGRAFSGDFTLRLPNEDLGNETSLGRVFERLTPSQSPSNNRPYLYIANRRWRRNESRLDQPSATSPLFFDNLHFEHSASMDCVLTLGKLIHISWIISHKWSTHARSSSMNARSFTKPVVTRCPLNALWVHWAAIILLWLWSWVRLTP